MFKFDVDLTLKFAFRYEVAAHNSCLKLMYEVKV